MTIEKNLRHPWCTHPLYKYTTMGTWMECPRDLRNPGVLIFEQGYWFDPTEEQTKKDNESEAIVKSLGGRMIQMPWEIAGKKPPISKADIESILETVKSDHPTAKIISQWNGEGFYTFSVAMDFV